MKNYSVLNLIENHCFLCQEPSGSLRDFIVVDQKFEVHQECWAQASGAETIEESYSLESWLELTGPEWDPTRSTFRHSSGTKHWFLNGQRHREDGPAIEWPNEDKDWFLNGQRHREDGPAIEFSNGSKHWYLNGKFHREDGPAVEFSNGDKEWWLNGQLHREDGPAIEYSDGNKYWYLNGEKMTEAIFETTKFNPTFRGLL